MKTIFIKEREVKTVIEKLTKRNFYVKIREDTKPMRQPSDDGRVNITKGEWIRGNHSSMIRVGTPLTVLEDTEELQLAYMRGRGNVTWGYADKKPYKIKFEKKQDILGMGKNKHWALLANRFDGSMLRNRLACYMADQLGMEYTPKMLPVDLVINGEYMGSYYLSELVRVGKNRVDIDELTPDDNEKPNVTGGYLLAMESPFSLKTAPAQNIVTTDRGESFSFESPEFYSEDENDVLGTPQQKAYIKNYLNETEDAVFGEDFKNSKGIAYTEYLDVQSAADFWWMQEFTVNSDAFISQSNYLYKNVTANCILDRSGISTTQWACSTPKHTVSIRLIIHGSHISEHTIPIISSV